MTGRSKISTMFGVSVAVLPVIHVASAQQAREEAELAFDTGAHGVFMIDHGGSARATLDAAKNAFHALYERGHERPWIGVNLLGMESDLRGRGAPSLPRDAVCRFLAGRQPETGTPSKPAARRAAKTSSPGSPGPR